MPSFDTMMKDSRVEVNMDEIKNMMKDFPQTDSGESAPGESMPAE